MMVKMNKNILYYYNRFLLYTQIRIYFKAYIKILDKRPDSIVLSMVLTFIPNTIMHLWKDYFSNLSKF